MTYKQYLKSKKLKSSTIKIYLWHLNKFLLSLDKKQLNTLNLNRYYQYLLENYRKIATINIHLSVINGYLKYKNNKYHFNLLSAEERDIKVLNNKQLIEFLNKPLERKGLISLRDKVLLELLYSTGLKVKEIRELKKNHLDYIKNELIIKREGIPITATAWYYLEKYLKKRKDNNPYLFISFDKAQRATKRLNKITPLSLRSIERILEKYALTFRPVLRITTQRLRDTLAYNLKRKGGDKKIIKKALHFKTKLGAERYFQKL